MISWTLTHKSCPWFYKMSDSEQVMAVLSWPLPTRPGRASLVRWWVGPMMRVWKRPARCGWMPGQDTDPCRRVSSATAGARIGANSSVWPVRLSRALLVDPAARHYLHREPARLGNRSRSKRQHQIYGRYPRQASKDQLGLQAVEALSGWNHEHFHSGASLGAQFQSVGVGPATVVNVLWTP